MKNIFVLLSALIINFSFAQQQTKNRNDKDLELGQSMELFFNTFQAIDKLYVDSTSPKKLSEIAINAMLDELDPYTEYISEDKRADFEFMTSGKYAGIGALIRQKDKWVEIAEPYKGTPSDKMGLKAGDRLLEINGKSLESIGSAKVSSLLKGEPNTTFILKYRPIKDTNTIKTITVTRELISIPVVPYYGMITDSIGYIQLTSFTNDASNHVLKAISELTKNTKFSSLTLDLRGNGGGSISQAVNIVGFFVPKNTTIVTLKGRDKNIDKTYKTKTNPIAPNLPLTVIISNSSASSSEIVAGALQDLDRAVIVGKRSFGKGLVQTPSSIGHNAMIKITIAKYYTPSGRCIQALDYTHRNDDGSVNHIPDSLINEFKTSNGRIIYDGGGIMPDVKTKPNYWSKFTAILVAYGFIDDFANIYAVKNKSQIATEFVLNDSIYKLFTEFMQDKKITYKSSTELALDKLKEEALQEKYIDRIDKLTTQIQELIKEDKNTELKHFEPEIKEAIANAIVTRWHYTVGAIERSINNNDIEIEKSIEILQNKKLYNTILKEYNTSKN